MGSSRRGSILCRIRSVFRSAQDGLNEVVAVHLLENMVRRTHIVLRTLSPGALSPHETRITACLAFARDGHYQVASLTQDDIARIAEREKQEAQEKQEERGIDNSSVNPEETNVSGGSRSATLNGDPVVQPASRQTTASNAEVSGSISPPSTSLSKSRLLMGVPVPEGPNVTKFLYIEVPEDNKEEEGSNAQDSSNAFDAEKEAARLCADLHDEREEEQSFLECLPSLRVTLSSR